MEVVTGQTVANEQTNAINQALGFFSTALLVFAFISLFVGSFTIFNTFSIIVGQRTRELAMLRIVGASRRQVFRSVLAEAADRRAGGLRRRPGPRGAGGHRPGGPSERLRLRPPAGSLVFGLRTVVVGLVVGIGVTVVSADQPGPAGRAHPPRGRHHRAER